MENEELFMRIREQLSLCYSIGSGYYGSKGILAVSAGIDFDKVDKTKQEVLALLEDCRQGKIPCAPNGRRALPLLLPPKNSATCKSFSFREAAANACGP